MNGYRIWAIARKESMQVVRDWRSLAMAIATPFTLLLLFGFALSLDVDHVPMIVWDQSLTPESRDLISRFTGSHYFNLVPWRAQNYFDIEEAIDKREAILALIIPLNFAARTNHTTTLQLIVDGSDSNTATLALGYAEGIVQQFSSNLLMEQIQRVGQAVSKPPIQLDTRIWFNPDLESKNTIVPGLISVIMMVISALLTSLTIAREWERGTMEQLISTPIEVPEIILGKLIPYFVIGMFDVLLVVIFGQVLFQVPLKGSWILLFGVSMIFMLGSLSLGIVISTIAKTQLLASQLAMIATFLPSFLLSGFITPIHHMPEPIQLISYLVPARYFLTFLKAIYLKGVGLDILAGEAILLCLYAIFMLAWAMTAFKKKLS
jgi:ABC-2 type transport system permease protein